MVFYLNINHNLVKKIYEIRKLHVNAKIAWYKRPPRGNTFRLRFTHVIYMIDLFCWKVSRSFSYGCIIIIRRKSLPAIPCWLVPYILLLSQSNVKWKLKQKKNIRKTRCSRNWQVGYYILPDSNGLLEIFLKLNIG